jgi:hypothetical protein
MGARADGGSRYKINLNNKIDNGISGQLAWVTVIRAPRDDNTTLRQTPAPTRSAGLKFQPRVAYMTSQSCSHKRFSSGLAVLALKSLPLTLPPARARACARVAGRAAGNG